MSQIDGSASIRLGHILAIMVRARRPISTQEIVDALPDALRTTLRTTQRQLELLSEVLPIAVDRNSKPYVWSYDGARCPCCDR